MPAKHSAGGIVAGETLLVHTRYKIIFNHKSPGHANLWVQQGWPGFVANDFAEFKRLAVDVASSIIDEAMTLME